MDNFKIKNNGDIIHIETDEILKKGDYVKVNILANKFNANDTMINIIGSLDNLALNIKIDDYLCPKYLNDNNTNTFDDDIIINES